MSWVLSCIGCGSKNVVDKEEAKVLDFRHYSLTSVPSYAFECERFLEELYLDFNQISELPRELFLCHELQILSLSDNDLHSLPAAISSLSNLAFLDLSKNGITDIPDSIKSCKRLRSVNASTNPLCRLPEGFTQLVALKELSLSDTFLEYLPANFGRLIGLEVLELRENQLNTLPRSITRLVSLKRLDLGQNEFTELPEVVGHLTSLTDLWIDNNRVKRIPPEIGNLVNLSFFDASKNRIQEIDPQFGNCRNLSDLYLTGNELETLPDSLCECRKLLIFHVDDNHLECLPENLGHLDNLIELKTSFNELSDLPASVGLLRNLSFLHIDNNLLSFLPTELGSCASLVVLTAAHNQIEAIPAEMGNLSNLRVLNLCGNLIQNLPMSLSKLQLTALWLSENQAKPTVPLQCMHDSTGHKVLTCFMLPQSVTQDPIYQENSEDFPLTEADVEAKQAARKIHFSSDGEPKPPGRLTRVPTPYPKELRALAKHTRNIQAMKKGSRDKEKGKAVDAKEDRLNRKDTTPVPPKKKSNILPTLKTSPEVKVAATVASESAIKPTPLTEDKFPSKDIVTSNPKFKSEVLPTELPVSLCQKDTKSYYKSTNLNMKNSTPEEAIEPLLNHQKTTSTEQISYAVNKVTNSPTKSMPPKDDKQLVFFKHDSAIAHVKTSLKEDTIKNLSSSTSPTSSEAFSMSSSQYQTANGKAGKVKEELTSFAVRPASIAIPDFTSTSPLRPTVILQRPGSLALEGSLPEWKNKRTVSLAAPINTVGIPLVDLTSRTPLQSPITGIQLPQKNLVLQQNFENVAPKPAFKQEPEPDLSKQKTETNFTLDSESLKLTWLSREPIKPLLSDDKIDHQYDSKESNEQQSFTSDKSNEHQLNTGLVSIINQVTEQALQEDKNSTNFVVSEETGEFQANVEDINSSGHSSPYFHHHSLQSVSKEPTYSNSSDAESSDKISGGPISKIPQLALSSKTSVTWTATNKPNNNSFTSKIQPPSSASLNSSALKISPDKVKTQIPTFAHLSSPPTKKEVDAAEEERRTLIPKLVSSEHTAPAKVVISPVKGPSRIPSLNSVGTKHQHSLPSPTLQMSIQTEKTCSIPVSASEFPVSKKIPSLIPVSPVEKPINQTGIPVFSSSNTPSEKSHIPTFANSSLRGKKSGVPVSVQKPTKHQVSPAGREGSNAWTGPP